jgi:hypothetical protein
MRSIFGKHGSSSFEIGNFPDRLTLALNDATGLYFRYFYDHNSTESSLPIIRLIASNIGDHVMSNTIFQDGLDRSSEPSSQKIALFWLESSTAYKPHIFYRTVLPNQPRWQITDVSPVHSRLPNSLLLRGQDTRQSKQRVVYTLFVPLQGPSAPA